MKKDLNTKNLEKKNEYLDVYNTYQNLYDRAINHIKKGILTKYNGHHILGEYETFYESPYGDDYDSDDYKITELMVNEKGDIYYAHKDRFDDSEWHYINGLGWDDILYIMSLYQDVD
jgi:hypothetical protein